MRTRKIDDEQFEQRIREKTVELITRYGATGWNMDRLAAETGTSRNTLYKIIGSREKLIETVFIDYIRSVQENIAAVISRDGGYVETLHEIIEAFSRNFSSPFTAALGGIFLEFPSIEKKVREHQDRITNRIIGFLQLGIDRGIIREDVTAGFIFDTLRAVVIYSLTSGLKGEALVEKLSRSFHCLAYGFIARGE